MKINPAGYDQYQSYVKKLKSEEGAGQGTARAGAAARADTVTLSGEAAARAESTRVAAGLAGEVESMASPARLDGLAQQVRDGSYYVSSEDIADTILDQQA